MIYHSEVTEMDSVDYMDARSEIEKMISIIRTAEFSDIAQKYLDRFEEIEDQLLDLSEELYQEAQKI